MKNKNNINPLVWLFKEIRRTIYIMLDEYRIVFRDSGLVVIFVGATILYPLLYSAIYRNETVRDMPVGVVDESRTPLSRDLIRRIDATPDLKVVYQFNNLQEVKDPFNRHEIHGVIYIPKDFSNKIHRTEQATVSIYSDMSSFMYYRAMMLGANFAILEAGNDIKIERMNATGVVGESAEISTKPFAHEGNIIYNEPMGFASFLLPALLILMIHQTLFFGITMIAGTAREEKRIHQMLSTHDRTKFYQTLIGKSLCYFTLYMAITAYILLLIPRLFQLPHIGNPLDIMQFMIPFLFAVIFFSMTISVFIRNRETGLVVFLFFSLILLFLSGFSWPQSNINWFWRTFGLLFPCTLGIQGYIKINSMGAGLPLVEFEYIGLWIQAAAYFVTTVIVYRLQQIPERRKLKDMA